MIKAVIFDIDNTLYSYDKKIIFTENNTQKKTNKQLHINYEYLRAKTLTGEALCSFFYLSKSQGYLN